MAKLSDMVKSIKKSTGAETIMKSDVATVQEFLSTGIYSVNRVLTGDINKGWAVGRINTIFGASQSGKSYIVANTIINTLKNDKVDIVYYFDSEGGLVESVYKNSDVDLSKIHHIPVASIEQCSVKMLTLFDALVKAREEYIEDPENNDNIRALVVLDSYGALSADKLITDAVKKDQMVQDMGLTAKLKNNLMRGLQMRVAQSHATMIIINHEYQDPSAMFTSKIHLMGGGKGLEFASHVILQCEKLLIKSDNNDFLTGLESNDDVVGYFKGNTLKFMTVKSRIVKPCFSAKVYVDFATGISKWDGLIDDAVEYGFIQDVRGGYIVPSYSDKRVTYKELVKNDEIWNTFIDAFNKKSIEVMQYSSSTKTAVDDLVSEVDEELNK